MQVMEPKNNISIVTMDDLWKDPNKLGNYIGDKLANLTRKAGSTVTGTQYKSIEEERKDNALVGKSMYGVPIGPTLPSSSGNGEDNFLMTILLVVIGGIALIKFLD